MDPSTGRPGQRGRTRQALLTAGGRLIARGLTPTTTEVADAAGISRRTAYRYFPTQEQLLIEASLERLRPEVEAAIAVVESMPALHVGRPDPEGDVSSALARLDATVRVMHRLTLEYEPLLRTIWRLTAGGATMPGVRPRGSRRVDWLTAAVDPLRPRLGPERFARLVSALTVCVGFDSTFVLMDLRGLAPADAERLTAWMAESIVRSSVADAMASAEDGSGREFGVA